MKAVIMAGGQGVRLRPLTLDTAKPLATLLSKPVIFHILDLLKRNKITDVVVTLGYKGKELEQALNEYQGIDISVAYEDTPLGTAGGVKNAVGDYKGEILVISGDAMCDFDLSSAIDFHRTNKAKATLIVKKVEDPREYGLVCCNKQGKITSFLEKPSYVNCVSDLANTGVYILSNSVMELVNPLQKADFAKDVFPLMMKENLDIYAFEDKGYWCDIGDIKSYMRCQADMLKGNVFFEIQANKADSCFYKNILPVGNFKLIPPVYIGKNVTIGSNTTIEQFSVIEDNVQIGENCHISGSIIHKGATLGNNVTLTNMVACKNASFEDSSSCFEGSVIGSGATIGKNATILSGVKVWNNKTVEEGITLVDDLQLGYAKEIIIDDDGITGQTNVVITPQLAAKIGASIGSILHNASIGIGYNDYPASKAINYALTSGIMSAGSNAYNFGECIESQFDFLMQKSQVDFGIYIDGGIVTVIKLVEKSGLPMRREYERQIESGMNRNEYKKASSSEFGKSVSMETMGKLYLIELMKLCDSSLEKMNITVKSTSIKTKQILEDVLQRLGCSNGDDIIVSISPNGKNLTITNSNGGMLTHERILALLCLADFLKGEDVSVPVMAPHIIDNLAEIHNRKVLRYSSCPCDDKDNLARQKASVKPYLRDGLMMAVKLFSFMSEKKLDFKGLEELVPDFSAVSRLVSLTINPTAIIKRLSVNNAELAEGISIEKNGANAVIRPVKSGKGLMIYTESVKSETAFEICDMFEKLIKDTALDS